MYEWLLFFHVLAAFLLVAGVGAFGALVLSGTEVARRALAPPGMALWNAGGIGTLVFGVWLALYIDGYELWDAWIIAALVLWLVASGVGDRLSRGVREGTAAPEQARRLVGVMALVTALLLVVMIYKPGA